MKAEIDKLDINKLVNVPTSLNNFKIKVDDLDVDKLKTITIDLRIFIKFNSHFISEGFMLCKKAVNNGLSQ